MDPELGKQQGFGPEQQLDHDIDQQLDQQYEVLFNGCLSNERPAELLLLWRRRVESMMLKEDIFFLGIYTVVAYLSHPMNLINDLRFLKIFCHLELEKKIRRLPYDRNNFSLYQKTHDFDIFALFDMYTYLLGMPPLSNEERYSVLKSFNMEEKRYLMNNLYPDFSETDFAVDGAFQFKAFEAFLATDEEFQDPPVLYSEYEKFKYLCLNGKSFASRSLTTSIIIVAFLFRMGFLPTMIGILFNVIFLQFGLFTDKFLFTWLYSRVVGRESVNSCRRSWKRLQTFMTPLPPGKYVGALSLCVEETNGKKHIEFKFCEDKYDQVLGQYYLSESQIHKHLLLTEYPNTGIFFWYSIISDVKITRRKIKINAYLSVEKFSPEFFLIDFQYFQPYAKNQLSRTMCLSALFELVRITLERHFPGSKISIISNGFDIVAPTTHMRVKISAVARHCLDKLGIGNSCNKTNRYRELKDKIYKDLVTRISICQRDMAAPMEYSAIVPISEKNQHPVKVFQEVEHEVTTTTYEKGFYQEVKVPSLLMSWMGLEGVTPTAGWISKGLDYEKRTLRLEHFEPKYRGFLRKRLAPLVAANFDHYSLGRTEPMESDCKVETEIKKEVVFMGYEKQKEKFPEYEKPGFIHRELVAAPVCSVIDKISAPIRNLEKGGKYKLRYALSKKKAAKAAKQKERRLSQVDAEVKQREQRNLDLTEKKLVTCGMCDFESSEYASQVVLKMAERRVKSAGLLYERVDKRDVNRRIKLAKERFYRRRALGNKSKFILSRSLANDVKKCKKGCFKNSRVEQLKNYKEYLTPYITNVSGAKLKADNAFKLFLMKRRLSDYGLAWKRIDDTLADFNITKNRLYFRHHGLPNRLKNLMRNIVKMVDAETSG
jgi:hypothetical protein